MINLVLPHERQAAGSHVSALCLGSPPSCRRNCTLRLFLAEKAYDFSMCVKSPHFPIKNIVNKELFNCGWRSDGEQVMIVDTNNDGGGVFLYHHHAWSMVFIVGLENCKHASMCRRSSNVPKWCTVVDILLRWTVGICWQDCAMRQCRSRHQLEHVYKPKCALSF